jgi:hypothetical protein
LKPHVVTAEQASSPTNDSRAPSLGCYQVYVRFQKVISEHRGPSVSLRGPRSHRTRFMPPHLLRRVVERLLEGLLRALRPSHVSCRSRGLQRGRSGVGPSLARQGCTTGAFGPQDGDAGSGVIYLDAHLHLVYDATVPSWLGASRARLLGAGRSSGFSVIRAWQALDGSQRGALRIACTRASSCLDQTRGGRRGKRRSARGKRKRAHLMNE